MEDQICGQSEDIISKLTKTCPKREMSLISAKAGFNCNKTHNQDLYVGDFHMKPFENEKLRPAPSAHAKPPFLCSPTWLLPSKVQVSNGSSQSNLVHYSSKYGC